MGAMRLWELPAWIPAGISTSTSRPTENLRATPVARARPRFSEPAMTDNLVGLYRGCDKKDVTGITPRQ